MMGRKYREVLAELLNIWYENYVQFCKKRNWAALCREKRHLEDGLE